ncbi:conserved hypothetical protein [Gammaproteobacteria bacterium]
MSEQAVLMSGDLKVRALNDDWSPATGWVDMGFADKLEIKVASDLKEMTSKGRDNYGQIIASVAVPKPAELTVEMSQLSNDNWSAALMGTLTTDPQVSGTADDEAHVVKKGESIALDYRAVSNVVVKNALGTVTYVEGTDYTVNGRLGHIAILASGAIASASTVKVSYDYAASTMDRIQGATKSQIKWEILLDGKNMADGRSMILRVFRALLTPNGAVDFMSNGFASLKMSGRMLTPSGATAPFTLDMSQ